ncbi:MAG TPA: toll/interleukin-1 receptor domain-containing protein [Candidatus Brocadiaceae bacterium]
MNQEVMVIVCCFENGGYEGFNLRTELGSRESLGEIAKRIAFQKNINDSVRKTGHPPDAIPDLNNKALYPELYDFEYSMLALSTPVAAIPPPRIVFAVFNADGVHLSKYLPIAKDSALRHVEINLFLQRNAGATPKTHVAAECDVFISHAEPDGAIAKEIADHLENNGWRTWYYERDNLPGPLHLEQTGRQIEASQSVLVLLSRVSIASEFVTAEVFNAHQNRKPLVPLLIDLTFDELVKHSTKWAQAVGFSSAIQWDADRKAEILKRLDAGITYLLG